MVQRVYATVAEYDALAESAFTDKALLAKRLRSASIEVEKYTRLSIFEADIDGYPVDAAIAAAFSESTCAIVEYWEFSDDPTGVEALAGSVKIGSVTLGTSATTRERPADALTDRIGTRAVDILRNAGLLSSTVGH